jgi:spore coat protein A
MLEKVSKTRASFAVGVVLLLLCALGVPGAFAVPVPGGTQNPLNIPKYQTALVIPPVMPQSTSQPGTPSANYNIAVRQFDQQILPTGFPATTVWSYGLAEDPVPGFGSSSTFNYPAFTVEAVSGSPTTVRWINELIAIDTTTGFPVTPILANDYLQHLVPVDQTLHWANPPGGTAGRDGHGTDPTPYTGPVPIVTHVHGAHVQPDSDGYPEAWWLPADADLYFPTYAIEGSLYDEAVTTNDVSGSAYFSYPNTQPATTLWYHDHALGITRANVYAGPAGFWMVRDVDDTGGAPAGTVGDENTLGLPGPAPGYGADPAAGPFYEIPIVIQDRSFNADGTLFYPDNRAFFEGLNVWGTAGTTPQFPGAGELQIPFVPDAASDIAPIWNPEAFFNTMVVNGKTWPFLNVEPRRYRFRLLNGCNSRFLNLALFEIIKVKAKRRGIKESYGQELPFYQIGSDQGFLPQVVQVQTGHATPLPGGGVIPKLVKAPFKEQSLLLGPAERADVIVDFTNLAPNTVIRMINTAPDAPFGGFPDIPADPSTTGQVMEFVVIPLNGTDSSTAPASLTLPQPPAITPPAAATASVSLNEEESALLCVNVDPTGNVVVVAGAVPPLCLDPVKMKKSVGVPFAPKAALLGTVDLTNPAMPLGVPQMWTDTGGTDKTATRNTGPSVTVNVTENPALDSTGLWDIYNFTVDAHPIHLHLVKFAVVGRQVIGGGASIINTPTGQQAWEVGFKDTVIAYPGEITSVAATFDIAGLYVWHCHIVEHEDNEMMRPYFVGP